MAKSDKATIAEAQAGTDDSKWMTPTKTKSLINAVLESSGVKIRSGSYVGTDTAILILNCQIVPKVVLISSINGFMTGPGTYGAGSFMNSMIWAGGSNMTVTFNQRTEYSAYSSISGTEFRCSINDNDCSQELINSYNGWMAICNYSGYTYSWVAIG